MKARIEELKENGHHFLVKDLYQTAVRAHLLHMPTVFQDTESAQMVTAGIATLKPSAGAPLKQELAEPLVLQAVIEHLQKQGSRHEEILKELLFDNQDDASTFGKVTEYYVGWVSCQSLGKATCTDPGLGIWGTPFESGRGRPHGATEAQFIFEITPQRSRNSPL